MKLFVMLSRLPYPLEKGDKLRAYHQLKYLSKHHEVHLCCISDVPVNDADRQAVEQICSSLTIHRIIPFRIRLRLFTNLFGKRPFQVAYFYDKRIQRKVREQVSALKPDHIYCQLVRTSEYVKRFYTIPKTIDYMDALGTGMQRMQQSASFWRKPIYGWEHKRLSEYESVIYDYFDHHVIISEQDRKLIRHPKNDRITVIPNGVDTAFFQPSKSPCRALLTFVGNLGYEPNINSVQYIADELLPTLRKVLPNASVEVSGASPSPVVLALANEHLTINGWVEDIRDAYNAGQFMIAPMRINTGLQNKILEAMSMEKLVFTSELANNAIGATHKEHLIVCKETLEYVDQIQWAVEHPEEAAVIARRGREWVEKYYGWDHMNRNLNEVLSSPAKS